MDIHIFEPQGISFLETESTFMTNELAEALTTSGWPPPRPEQVPLSLEAADFLLQLEPEQRSTLQPRVASVSSSVKWEQHCTNSTAFL